MTRTSQFEQQCRHAIKNNNLNLLQQVFARRTEKMMNPQTRHAKLEHMIHNTCLLAAEYGKPLVLSWLKLISYYDIRHYPIDASNPTPTT